VAFSFFRDFGYWQLCEREAVLKSVANIVFVSDVAHGNFSVETPPSQDLPVQSDVYVEKKHATSQGGLPGA
jgi:hypothetical protein